MKPSWLFFDLVEHFEGCRLTAYKDIAGIYTIGYGTTIYPDNEIVRVGDTCTIDEAQSYVIHHIAGAQMPSVEQWQFDAVLDLIYNIGQSAFNSSSLKVAIINNDIGDTITEDFCKWDRAHINGQLVEVDGLLRRRKCEAYLYYNGENHPTFYQ